MAVSDSGADAPWFAFTTRPAGVQDILFREKSASTVVVNVEVLQRLIGVEFGRTALTGVTPGPPELRPRQACED